VNRSLCECGRKWLFVGQYGTSLHAAIVTSTSYMAIGDATPLVTAGEDKGSGPAPVVRGQFKARSYYFLSYQR
jgi:hypothetical protein